MGNSALVVRLARRYRDSLPRGLTWQDFLQEGEIGLAQATRKFDPGQGGDFKVYAEMWIVGCFRAIIAATTLNPLGFTFAPDPDEAVDERGWDEVEAERLADEVWDAVERLPAFDREVVIRRFGLDGYGPESKHSTAMSMGVGREAIGASMKKSVATMKSLLGEEVPRKNKSTIID